MTVGDIRGTTTTTTATDTATVLKCISNAFGSGWTLQGLQQITTATGGVIFKHDRYLTAPALTAL